MIILSLFLITYRITMIKIATNVLGSFALKNGRVIKKVLFPQEPKEIADRLAQTEDSVCPEEIELVTGLVGTGVTELYVDNPGRFYGRNLGVEFIEDRKQVDPKEIARELGFPEKEIDGLVYAASVELTKKKLRVLERDQILMQAVSSLDDVEEVNNRLLERLREWYSLNFPELDVLVRNQSLYARIVAAGGVVSMDGGLLAQIEKAREETVGMEFSESDASEVKRLAESVVKLDAFREDTEKYIEELMKEIAPNACELAGPLLGARMISVAGGLERLSRLPASTIQILGAEEAFFRFLKTRDRPPKHGIIFQLPEIRSAPKHLRGKIARKFASKMAIAAKSDFFHGEYVGKNLRESFLKGVEELKKQPAKLRPERPQGALYGQKREGFRQGDRRGGGRGERRGAGQRGGGRRDARRYR